MGFASQPPMWRVTWGTIPHTACTTVQRPEVPHNIQPLEASSSGFTKNAGNSPLPEIPALAVRIGPLGELRTASVTSPLSKTLSSEDAEAIVDQLFFEASHYNFERRAEGVKTLARLYTTKDNTKKPLHTILASPARIARAFELCVGTLHAAHLHHLKTHARITALADAMVPCLRTLWPLLDAEHTSSKRLLRVALKEIAEDIDSADSITMVRATFEELFPLVSRTRAAK